MLRCPSLPLPRRHGVRLLSKPQTGLASFPLCQFENTLGLGTSSTGAEDLGIGRLTVSTDPAGSRASPPPSASGTSSRKQDMAGLPRSPQHARKPVSQISRRPRPTARGGRHGGHRGKLASWFSGTLGRWSPCPRPGVSPNSPTSLEGTTRLQSQPIRCSVPTQREPLANRNPGW